MKRLPANTVVHVRVDAPAPGEAAELFLRAHDELADPDAPNIITVEGEDPDAPSVIGLVLDSVEGTGIALSAEMAFHLGGYLQGAALQALGGKVPELPEGVELADMGELEPPKEIGDATILPAGTIPRDPSKLPN